MGKKGGKGGGKRGKKRKIDPQFDPYYQGAQGDEEGGMSKKPKKRKIDDGQKERDKVQVEEESMKDAVVVKKGPSPPSSLSRYQKLLTYIHREESESKHNLMSQKKNDEEMMFEKKFDKEAQEEEGMEKNIPFKVDHKTTSNRKGKQKQDEGSDDEADSLENLQNTTDIFKLHFFDTPASPSLSIPTPSSTLSPDQGDEKKGWRSLSISRYGNILVNSKVKDDHEVVSLFSPSQLSALSTLNSSSILSTSSLANALHIKRKFVLHFFIYILFSSVLISVSFLFLPSLLNTLLFHI